MLKRYTHPAALLLLLSLCLPARAELTIEITGAGAHQTPVTIVPFAGEDGMTQRISAIVAADLARTGLFKLVEPPAGKAPHDANEVNYGNWPGIDALVVGRVTRLSDGSLTAKYYLLDAVRQTQLLSESASAGSSQVRTIAHHVADNIFEKLTGDRGVFSTRIAYVNHQGPNYRLVIADSDGYGEQTAMSNTEPIMSPAWSPDGSRLAYVSFEQRHAVVFVQMLQTGKRLTLAQFPGSNSAPTWSPDGQQLVIALTHDGSSQLYLIKSDGTGLRRVSFSGAIDTEPHFSPDGKALLFTSDQGGSPQIYRIMLEGGRVPERMTFGAGQNFSPRYSPDGKSFTFTHLEGGRFKIAVQDFATQQMQLLTEGGWEKRPSFAPNGKLILFSNEAQRRGILSTISSDGRVKQKMFAPAGDISEPIWGPFTKQ